MFQVCCEFRYDAGEEVKAVVFPCAFVGKAVAPSAVTYQVGLVYIIHAYVVEAVSHGKSLAKHHQSCHREAFSSCVLVGGHFTHVAEGHHLSGTTTGNV